MEKRIKISVCGSEQAINKVVCESLNEIKILEIVNSDDVSQADVIYWIYGKGPSIKKFFPVWIKKEPIIINHWVGSDVIGEMQKNQRHAIFRIGDFIRDCIFHWKMRKGGLINLTAAPWLVDELAKLHINATYLPITTIDKNTLGPVDIHQVKDIDFLSYVPLRSFEFYGGDNIIRLAQRWQNYTFLLIFPDLTEIPLSLVEKMPRNVIISPRVNRVKMNELFNRSKFFIRYTQHDAISLSVLEALYFNLQVLWTYDFPFTQKIETLEKLSDSIPSLMQNWHPNEDGHEFVIENYTTEKYKENFVKILKSKISFPE
jgi:hypothetical protein